MVVAVFEDLRVEEGRLNKEEKAKLKGKSSDGMEGQVGGEKVGLTFLRTLLVTLGRGMGALTSPISICHVHEVCQEARIERWSDQHRDQTRTTVPDGRFPQ